VIAEVLAALAEGLGTAGIRWYLFGAQAAILYGVPRLTADVDATAEYPVDRAEKLARLLLGAGFEPRVGEIGAFARHTRVIPLAHVSTGIPVDLVLAGAGLEEEFLDRAQLIDVGGVRVPVITADDLIVTKVLAGRSKDLEDVRDVLRQQSVSLDLDRIRRLLSALEAALDRADLLPALEAALNATKEDGTRR